MKSWGFYARENLDQVNSDSRKLFNEGSKPVSSLDRASINDDDWYEVNPEHHVVKQSGPQSYKPTFGTRIVKLPSGNRAMRGMTLKSEYPKKVSEDVGVTPGGVGGSTKTFLEADNGLQQQLETMQNAVGRMRDITKGIKYDDTVMQIITDTQTLANSVGIDKSDIEYLIRDVYEAQRALESAVYTLEDAFTDKLRDIQNQIEDQEYGNDEVNESKIIHRRK